MRAAKSTGVGLCRRSRYNHGMVGRAILFIVLTVVLSVLYVFARSKR
jgi:hypothetical protein